MQAYLRDNLKNTVNCSMVSRNMEDVMKRLQGVIRESEIRFVSIFSVILVTMVLLLGVALISRVNAAEATGTPRDVVVKFLGERHAEAPVAYGLAANGGLIEVFTTADGATWTIVLTMPNGMSVVVGSGEAWTRRPPVAVGRPS